MTSLKQRFEEGQFRFTHSADGRHLELVFPDTMTTDDILEEFRKFLLGAGWPVKGEILAPVDDTDVVYTADEHKELMEKLDAAEDVLNPPPPAWEMIEDLTDEQEEIHND